MIIESTAILKNAVDSSPFEVGTGYLPRIEQNDEGGVIIGGGSLWLTDTGNEANEDAAWKFIEYITTPDVQAKWSMGTGYFAINEKAYETEDMKAYLKENPGLRDSYQPAEGFSCKLQYSRCSLRCTDRSPSYIQRDHAAGI